MTVRLEKIKELIKDLSVEEFQELVDYVAWPPKPEAPMHPAWDTTVKPQDSTGQLIFVGDRVRWRGDPYTVKGFGPRTGRLNSAILEFEEPIASYILTDPNFEPPDEISVDKVLEPLGIPRVDGQA